MYMMMKGTDMNYLKAIDCNDGWVVVYVDYKEDFTAGPSSSIWLVPGTLED